MENLKEHTREPESGTGPEEPASAILLKAKGALKTLREIMIGLTVHEMSLELRKEKGHLNQLFMLIVFGDMVGMPILPPYYSMRLLPYIVPSINRWKRSLLRQRDLTDLANMDI
ncbi:MAG: hypothetical protein PHS17_09975 [Desulfobacterales bacterium]|nr:hypothetical protein [Desulfobacterales bacterium]